MKQMNLPDVIVTVEKSGNRFNAWDSDGTKWTSSITTGARKKAFNGNYPLGRFTNKSGKVKKVDFFDISFLGDLELQKKLF